MLVADAARIRKILGWKPVLDDIDVIESAYCGGKRDNMTLEKASV